jgi:hypothetical protein
MSWPRHQRQPQAFLKWLKTQEMRRILIPALRPSYRLDRRGDPDKKLSEWRQGSRLGRGSMRAVCHQTRFAICMLVFGGLAAYSTVPAAAGEPPASPDGAHSELDEVLVQGQTRVDTAKLVMNWFARLSGEFELSGSLRIHRSRDLPDRLPIVGRGACASYFPNPGAQCELRILVPDAKARVPADLAAYLPALDAAVILLGYGSGEPPILHLIVDGQGIAEDGAGNLHAGHTLVTRTKCAGVPGDCSRTLRITAEEGSQVISMSIGTEVASHSVLSLDVTMLRVATVPAGSP